jgi:hypothetical protein
MLVLSKRFEGERWTSVDGQEPIMVFGRVTRGDGAPVPGAALTLCDLSGDQLDRAAADEGGHFQLVPPTGGTYLVICSSSTHQPQASLVAVADRPRRHDIDVAGGGATLGGTVGVHHGGGSNGHTGPGGVSGQGDVVLTLTDARGTVVAVTRSDDEGTYRFSDLAEGTYTLTAAAARLAPVAGTVRVPAEGQVAHEIALATRTRLTGTVRSAGAGRPVAEALATLVGEDGQVVGSRVTGEDGRGLGDRDRAGAPVGGRAEPRPADGRGPRHRALRRRRRRAPRHRRRHRARVTRCRPLPRGYWLVSLAERVMSASNP